MRKPQPIPDPTGRIPVAKFTDRTRTVLLWAHESAVELGNTAISPAHMILGILREGDGVAAAVLTNRGVPFAALEGELREQLSGLERPVAEKSEVTWGADSVSVLEQAVAEAREMSHYYLGTEHVLLGLLRDSGSMTGRVLARYGMRWEDAHAEVVKLLHGPWPNE